MLRGMRRHWKKEGIIIALGAAFALWLWHDKDVKPVLLISNILSMIALLFLVVGVAEFILESKGNTFASFGEKRYIFPTQQVFDRNEPIYEPKPGEEELEKRKEWPYVRILFFCCIVFMALSLLIWFLFRNMS